MREIKYQAYDSANSKMLDWETLKSHIIMPGSSGWHWREFTGLKDKQGKEIYEGDIVVNHYYEGVVFTVYWEADDIPIGFRLEEKSRPPKFKDIDFREDKQWWELEVIGNIYENPESLKSV